MVSNMIPGNIRFRGELSLWEVLEYSFRVYRRGFVNLFTPYLILGAAFAALNHWALSTLPPFPMMDLTGSGALLDWLLSLSKVILVIGVVGWILTVVIQGYSVGYSSTLLAGETLKARELAGRAIRRAPRLLAASFTANLLIGIGLILLIVPGVIFAVMFSLIIPVIMLEDRGAFESLSDSRRLVSKRWGKTLTLLIILVAAISASEILGGMIAVAFEPMGYIISVVITAIVEPIYPVAVTCLYYSMKAKEAAREEPEMRPKPVPAKYCIECGEPLSPIAVYCPRCGTRQP
ncbi:MAG: zinc ribbon domain-containing protein [Candidatus Bathyarchaeia archaeon]